MQIESPPTHRLSHFLAVFLFSRPFRDYVVMRVSCMYSKTSLTLLPFALPFAFSFLCSYTPSLSRGVPPVCVCGRAGQRWPVLSGVFVMLRTFKQLEVQKPPGMIWQILNKHTHIDKKQFASCDWKMPNHVEWIVTLEKTSPLQLTSIHLYIQILIELFFANSTDNSSWRWKAAVRDAKTFRRVKCFPFQWVRDFPCLLPNRRGAEDDLLRSHFQQRDHFREILFLSSSITSFKPTWKRVAS